MEFGKLELGMVLEKSMMQLCLLRMYVPVLGFDFTLHARKLDSIFQFFGNAIS